MIFYLFDNHYFENIIIHTFDVAKYNLKVKKFTIHIYVYCI